MTPSLHGDPLKAELQAAIGCLMQARRALQDGQMNEFQQLMARLARLPQHELLTNRAPQRLRPQLLALVDEIERLRAGLVAAQGQLARRLREADQRRSAELAYRQMGQR